MQGVQGLIFGFLKSPKLLTVYYLRTKALIFESLDPGDSKPANTDPSYGPAPHHVEKQPEITVVIAIYFYYYIDHY